MAHAFKLATVLLSAAAFLPGVAMAQVATAGVPASQDVPPPGGVSQPDDQAVTPALSPEEVVVTARRRNERLLDSPVAITAVSGETLANYNVSRVSDIATQVPSLVAGKAASGSAASIFLRGVGSTALSAGFDQSVSFVIDGLPMSRGREISLPQFDIQGVEVLKGPQALFFGKNTTGGLISVTSKSPTNEFEAGVKGGYGFESREKYGEAYISGPLTDTIRARIAGRYSDADGAFTNTAADTYTNYIPGQFRTRNADRRGFGESYGARGTLEWEPSTALSLQLKGGFAQVNDGGPTDLIERICGGGRTVPFAANGLPASPNADCRINGRSDSSKLPVQVAQTNYRNARNGEMYSDFGSQNIILTGNVTSDPFDVTSISGYYHFTQADLNNVSGEAYPASFSQGTDFKQFSQELRFQSKFDGALNVLFGAFYANSEFKIDQDAYIAPVPLDPVTNTFTSFKKDTGFTNDALSFFAQGILNINEQIELSGGARYSIESRDSIQRSFNANQAFAAAFPGGITIRDRYRDDNISPEVTLRYKPERDTTIYAAYKQGFKAGGFNISQTINAATAISGGRYGAETAEGGEIGFRTIQFDRRLSFNVTGYHYVYSDLQVQFFDPVTISQVAEMRASCGRRAWRSIRPASAWDRWAELRGAAAYNDAEYRDFIGQCYPGQSITQGCNLQRVGAAFTAQDYEGRRPPKAPKWAGACRLYLRNTADRLGNHATCHQRRQLPVELQLHRRSKSRRYPARVYQDRRCVGSGRRR